MKAIPGELYEAASVDGATVLQRFVHVTLPGLKNIMIIVVLLSTIWTFNDFGIVYILTKGGPGGATQVLPVLTYEIAFGAQRLGEVQEQGRRDHHQDEQGDGGGFLGLQTPPHARPRIGSACCAGSSG